MNPTDLNFKPGVQFGGMDNRPNMLTHALQLAFPHRVSPRMLEGLREPDDNLTRLTRQAPPVSTLDQLNNPALTNEQIAELALHQAMGGLRR
jgi:hypothetical protein